jgi:hypothetical protein
MINDPKMISKLLEKDITLSADDICERLCVENSASNRLQVEKARSELVRKLGHKKTIFEFIRCLDRIHKTNNWLPIHILRESLLNLIPSDLKISRAQQDKILIELASTDQLLEFGYLKEAQYSQYVINQSIETGPGEIIYFIRQKVITADILEASAKLDPGSMKTSSDLVSPLPPSKRASSKLDPRDPLQVLKNFVDHLDLSEPKERASQVAFNLNNDLKDQFQVVCQQNGISIREGFHVALTVFNHNFDKTKLSSRSQPVLSRARKQ